MQILDRILEPAVVWVIVPLAWILCSGLVSAIHALKGTPEDGGEWADELRLLRQRIEALERSAHGTADGADPSRRAGEPEALAAS